MTLLFAELAAAWHGIWHGHQIATYQDLDGEVGELWCLDCFRHFYQKPRKKTDEPADL